VQVTPLMPSVPFVETVTSLVYQPPRPSVPDVTERATPVGAVLSTLTVRGVAFATKPAPLVQEPLKVTPVVSVVRD
jgi:hypothetical protein